MSRHRAIPKAEHLSTQQSSPLSSPRARQPEVLLADSLHHVFQDSANDLEPGDIIVLDESKSLRAKVEPDFFAVLACPRCGTLDLITPPQYFGAVPVICGSDVCSCCFRINDESHLVYLRAN